MFMLLLELNLIWERRWKQFELKIVPAEFLYLMTKYTLPFGKPVNRITTKVFDNFRIITLKQQKFPQSDPVLIRPKLASVLIQSDPVLIRAHP